VTNPLDRPRHRHLVLARLMTLENRFDELPDVALERELLELAAVICMASPVSLKRQDAITLYLERLRSLDGR
jgi:hypothetical protein